IADVAAEALTDAVEHRSIHHQAANITRKVVGRATEQTIRPRGNSTVSLEPSLQILARPRQQEIGREGFSFLLERNEIADTPAAVSWRFRATCSSGTHPAQNKSKLNPACDSLVGLSAWAMP